MDSQLGVMFLDKLSINYNMNFNSEQYSVVDIKKMFNLLDNVNFFGDFTLQDVESVKKKLYLIFFLDSFLDFQTHF
jgi:hypothetical protein